MVALAGALTADGSQHSFSTLEASIVTLLFLAGAGGDADMALCGSDPDMLDVENCLHPQHPTGVHPAILANHASRRGHSCNMELKNPQH